MTVLAFFKRHEALGALLMAAGLFILGSLAIPGYSSSFSVRAMLVMAGLLAVDRDRPLSAGFRLALATTIDLTAVFFAVALCWPLLRRAGRRGLSSLGVLVPYALGALPILALHFGVTYAIGGDLRPLGLHTEAFEYPLSPFVFMSLTGGGEASPDGSGLAYALGALFGQSGLFSHHPVLLWALVVGLLSLPRLPVRGRPLALAVLAAAGGIAAYYLTQSRNFGGSSFGMRWFTVFAPALFLPAALALVAGRRLRLGLFLPLLLWSAAAASLGAAQPWAKFHYRFEDSPQGMVARPGEPVPGRVEHWKDEWRRVTTLQGDFSRKGFDDLYQRLMDQHQRLYLRDYAGVPEAEQRVWIEGGLSKLQRAVDLLDRANLNVPSRAVGHFWLGRFHQRLGDRVAAKREYELTLALDPGYVWAERALSKLNQAD